MPHVLLAVSRICLVLSHTFPLGTSLNFCSLPSHTHISPRPSCHVTCPHLHPQATFYGGRKLEALMHQASWVAHMLLAVAHRGPLLSYVPSCYMEMVIDSVMAYRRAADSAFKRPQDVSASAGRARNVLVCLVSLYSATLNHLRQPCDFSHLQMLK